ncbi:hypothetical protein JTB14_035374 [Gonioctena quinquepunctata]|nr:hypothetical protein JTB14_035374 [Gonioctena quinquepunctata]
MGLETDNANVTKSKPSASSKKSTRYDCTDCAKFRRKLKENEQTVSARDVLIEMSQKEIQKLQNLYKNSIDEYEKLRFTYCSLVQDFTNLKHIYKKVEEENDHLVDDKNQSTAKLNDLRALQDEYDQLRNQYEELQKSKRSIPKCFPSKCKRIEQSSQTSRAAREQTEDNLIDEIGNLKKLVEKLKEENKKIKENLNEKQTNLFKCLNVLEKNHLDIGNLSGHIENICNERNKCMNALGEKDNEICRLKCMLKQYQETAGDIEIVKRENEKYYQENIKLNSMIESFKNESQNKDAMIDGVENQMMNLNDELTESRRTTLELQDRIEQKRGNNGRYVEKLNILNKELREKHRLLEEKDDGSHEKIRELQETMKGLNETLAMLTEENSSNLKTIENTKTKLKDSQKEDSQCKGKCDVFKLRVEVEDLKKQLQIAKSQADEAIGDSQELEELKERIQSLEGELDNSKLEIAEYEEENKACRQKLELMMKDLDCLHEEKVRVEDDNFECCCRMNQMRKEFSELISEKDEIIMELQKKIEILSNRPPDDSKEKELKRQMEILQQEKERVVMEKRELQSKVRRLESELEDSYKETSKMISSLEEKINMLEERDRENQQQLKCYCAEIKRIQKTLEENQKNKVKDLETKCMIQDAEILKLRHINLEQTEQIDSLENSLEHVRDKLKIADVKDLISKTGKKQRKN